MITDARGNPIPDAVVPRVPAHETAPANAHRRRFTLSGIGPGGWLLIAVAVLVMVLACVCAGATCLWWLIQVVSSAAG